MRRLAKPAQSVRDVYLLCVQSYSDPVKKQRLLSITSTVENESVLFESAAAQATACVQMRPATNVGAVSKDEMIRVYDEKLVGGSGRAVYDKLRHAPNGICPLCVQRKVYTLDHYLDKARYPALAVTPANLVPCCRDCNSAKNHHHPAVVDEQTLHPYFDDLGHEPWLQASVLETETEPVAVAYHVRAPGGWDAILAKRVQTHFDVLKLGELYATHAAEQLVGMRYQLLKIAAGGALALREHLEDCRDSWNASNANSWQSALFAALASSKWFCSSGYERIPR